jgi:hypothetical protein
VKLKVYASLFVPTGKWAMLLTGNYRCVQKDWARSIHEAVHSDIEKSRAVYGWVQEVCVRLGAAPADLYITPRLPLDTIQNSVALSRASSPDCSALPAQAIAESRVAAIVSCLSHLNRVARLWRQPPTWFAPRAGARLSGRRVRSSENFRRLSASETLHGS